MKVYYIHIFVNEISATADKTRFSRGTTPYIP
jgi:hypothetical protein